MSREEVSEAGPPIFADPKRMAMASALFAAHISCDYGEDVDRLVDELEARGVTLAPMAAQCPACGGSGHEWWTVGDDSYACAATSKESDRER